MTTWRPSPSSSATSARAALSAGGPAGLGRSVIVDPEGLVRVAAGDGDELLTDVLDLDAVARVRRFGTAGVSRMWEQLDRDGADIELPMYGGAIRPRPRGAAGD